MINPVNVTLFKRVPPKEGDEYVQITWGESASSSNVEVSVVWGKFKGEKGSPLERSFPTAEAARKMVDKYHLDALNAGYTPVPPPFDLE